MSEADTVQNYRDMAHELLCEAEASYWEEFPGAALPRFAWRTWYELGQAHVDRLIAEASAFQQGDQVAIGGVERLHERVQQVLGELGPAPAPTAAVACSEPRVEVLQNETKYGQLASDVESRDRVAAEICQDFPYGGRVLLLGDDDLVCEAVASAGFATTVVDIDERVGERIATVAGDVEFIVGDVRRPLDIGTFDAVVLDPADGSVALAHWFRRVHDHVAPADGACAYLSVNPCRLGRRWAALVADLARHDLVPVRQRSRLKRYPTPHGPGAATDLWIFERMTLPSLLPLPYVDIETHR